ncbi:MAG: tetratricopeptide repeat protein [Gammaproteobacteria bacterium]|nr:tetratricopeptide repeat protein [Gammaproteobacteria bacterium]
MIKPLTDKLQLSLLITIILLITLLKSSAAFSAGYDQLIIYTLGNSELESIDKVDKNKKLEQAFIVLTIFSEQNNIEQGIARLQLAKQLARADRLDESFEQLQLAYSIFLQLNKPVHLANTIYIKALVTAIYNKQYNESTAIFQQAIDILKSIPQSKKINKDNLNDLLFRASNRLASLYLFLRDDNRAYELLLDAEQLLKNTKSKDLRTSLIRSFSMYYIKKGDIKKAEQYLIKTYQQAVKIKDHFAIIESLSYISKFYRHNKRHQLAIDYSLKAVEASLSFGATSHQALSYNNLAISFAEAGNDNLAIVNYLNSVNLLKGMPAGLNTALAQHNIGETYSRIGKHDKAYDYLIKANALFKKIGHHFYQLSNNIAIAELLFKQQKYQLSIQYAQSGLMVAKKMSKQDEMLVSHRILEKNYRALKQPDQEIKHIKQISVILSQQNDDLTKTITETVKNEHQIELVALEQTLSDSTQKLSEEKKTNKALLTQRTILTVAIAIILCSLIGVWLRAQTRMKLLTARLQRSLCHQFTQLPIFREDDIESNPTHPLNNSDFIISFNIEFLEQTRKPLSVSDMKSVQSKLFNDIKQLINRDIYQFSDSIFITTLTIDEHNNVENQANQMLQTIIESTPEYLTIAAAPSHHIAMGIVNISSFKQADISKSINSTLEFSLAALSAAQYLNGQLNSSHWIYLAPKPENSSAMFSISTRQQWLNSLSLNLIPVKHNAKEEIVIPWLKFNDTNQKLS